MPEQIVRAALVGVGRWAGVIATGAREVPDLEIVGCFSRTEERREAFAVSHGCRSYSSFEAVLADGEIDSVLLVTPHSTHLPQIVDAARAGKHVFVEKPMTLSTGDARLAIESCEAAGVILMVGHCWRWLGPVVKTKAILEVQGLGTVTQATGHFGNPRGRNFGQEGWRDEPSESPGGPMTGPGFHLLDILHHLLGPVQRVNATFARRHPEGRAVDSVIGSLMFQSGVLAQISSSFITQRCFQISLLGTEANAYLNLEPQKGAKNVSSLAIQREVDPLPIPVKVPDAGMIQHQLSAFAKSVRTRTAPPTDGRTGFELIALLEALSASAVSRCWESPVLF